MSFDTLFSLALFAGALFLMMRFGCGAHMGHTHSRGGARSNQTRGAAPDSRNGENGASPGSVSSGNVSAAKSNASLLETTGDPSPGSQKVHRHGCC